MACIFYEGEKILNLLDLKKKRTVSNKGNLVRNIQIMLFIISILSFMYGVFNNSFNLQLIAILLLWLNNIMYSFDRFLIKFAFFLFNVTFFVFLLARPTIDLFRGGNWAHYESSSIQFALNAYFLGLLFMFVGAIIGEKIKFGRKELRSDSPQIKLRRKWISFISFLGFVFCLFCSLVIEVSKLLFVLKNSYEAYYSEYSFSGPGMINTFAGMLPFILCIYLATFPNKKFSYFVLIAYIVASIPTLLMGQRNPIVLRFLFSIVYFVIRDFHEVDGTKWMGKFEKVSLLFGVPLGVLFLSATNYIRKGSSVAFNPIGLFIDFLHKQGTSFDTVCFGFANLDKLPFYWEKNYTFGGIIDIFKYGFISQKLFSAPEIGNNNGILMGMKSNNLAHNLAYIFRKDEYMQGNGNGSSYLLELYADYGYLGIICFSILLGIFLTVVVRIIRRNSTLINIFLLGILLNLFLMPRSAVIGCIKIFFKPSFIVPLLGCYLVAYFFTTIFDTPSKTIKKLYGKVMKRES